MLNGKIQKCKLSDVLYVPDLLHNLLSVSKAASNGKSFEFGQSHCNIVDNKFGVIVTASKCRISIIWIVLVPTCQWRRIIQPWNVQVLTEQRRASGTEARYILEQKIWNKLQRNNWLIDLIMNQRRNQVFVNHVLMVPRVHCHFPRQEEKGLMNSLILFTVMYVERLRQSGSQWCMWEDWDKVT